MTKIITPDQSGILEASSIIKSGGLVAFPTETVYGLGANGFSETAVSKIFDAKGRPYNNPLILHLFCKEDVLDIADELTSAANKLLEIFSPGPLTLVAKRKTKVPAIVSAGLDSIAFRIPANEIALSLIKNSGVPIAAPSANSSGSPSPTCVEDVMNDLNGKIDAVIDGGRCEIGIESTVLDVRKEPFRILRPGGVTIEELATVLGYKPEFASDDAAESSPGTKHQHYKPNCSIKLFSIENPPFLGTDDGIAGLTFTPPQTKYSVKLNSLEEYGRRLYSIFREADKRGIETMFLELPPSSGIGIALIDRLKRAEDER